MKTITQYISQIMSPYDENILDDQIQLTRKGYILYQQDTIINSIAKKENIYNISLFLDNLLNNLNAEKKRIFLKKILDSLMEKYSFQYLIFYNDLRNLDKIYQNEIIELLKFLETQNYFDFLASILPAIPIECCKKNSFTKKFIKDTFFISYEQIKKIGIKYPYLLKVFFTYSAKSDIIEFLTILLNKDTISIISKQKEKEITK